MGKAVIITKTPAEKRAEKAASLKAKLRSKGHTCWKCKMPWKGTGPNQCGNAGCGGPMARIKQSLQLLSSLKSKVTIDGKETHEFRGCPRCSTIIAHKQACKHMTCGRNGHAGAWMEKSGCSHQFCFICLKNWSGHSNSACKVAKKQTLKDLENCSDTFLRGQGNLIQFVPRMRNDTNLYKWITPPAPPVIVIPPPVQQVQVEVLEAQMVEILAR